MAYGTSYGQVLGGRATGSNSVAIARFSKASGDYSVALGNVSATNEEFTISVGNEEVKRRIVDVTASIKANDAATVGQLNE